MNCKGEINGFFSSFTSHCIIFHSLLHKYLYVFSIVFVSSKSCIYITPNESKITSSNANRIDASELLPLSEPIYENIEKDDDGNNIVPSDNNKFTIYVNYDFIKKKGEKSKSSVRLLEPDVKLVHMNENGDIYYHAYDEQYKNSSTDNVSDDNDEENNNGKSMSKMIQCQQISMYIGEKKLTIFNEGKKKFKFVISCDIFLSIILMLNYIISFRNFLKCTSPYSFTRTFAFLNL